VRCRESSCLRTLNIVQLAWPARRRAGALGLAADAPTPSPLRGRCQWRRSERGPVADLPSGRGEPGPRVLVDMEDSLSGPSRLRHASSSSLWLLYRQGPARLGPSAPPGTGRPCHSESWPWQWTGPGLRVTPATSESAPGLGSPRLPGTASAPGLGLPLRLGHPHCDSESGWARPALPQSQAEGRAGRATGVARRAPMIPPVDPGQTARSGAAGSITGYWGRGVRPGTLLPRLHVPVDASDSAPAALLNAGAIGHQKGGRRGCGSKSF
jgi:hypothetical protein